MFRERAFAKDTKYGILNLGVSIRNPERYTDYMKVFSIIDGKTLTDDLLVEVFDTGIEMGVWKYKDKTVKDKCKRMRNLIAIDLFQKGLNELNNKDEYTLTDLGKGFLDESISKDDLFIKYLCAYKYPNPTTSKVLNNCSPFYLLLKSLKEINKRIGPKDKQGEYKTELILCLSAKTNDYTHIVDSIVDSRKKNKTKKNLSEWWKYIGNKEDYINVKDDSAESYVDVFYRYLKQTRLFHIHGKINPLINISDLGATKIDLLIEAFERGDFDCDTSSFEYSQYTDALYNDGITVAKYNKWIWNIKLPWEENEKNLKLILSSQEKHLFNRIYPKDSIKTRQDRIDKYSNKQRIQKFIDNLPEYDLTLDKLLYSSSNKTNCYNIENYVLYEATIGAYVYNKAGKYKDDVSVLVNTIFDDDGNPIRQAPGDNGLFTGEDICAIFKNYFIAFEPTLRSGSDQAKYECSACARHLDKLNAKLNLPGYSIIVSNEISYDTADNVVIRVVHSNFPHKVLAINTTFFKLLMKNWIESNNPDYLKEYFDKYIKTIQTEHITALKLMEMANVKN